jgi:hypothetical protein
VSSPTVPEAFTDEQKEYLQGFFAGLSARKLTPFVGILSDGRISAAPAPGLENQAVPPARTEQTVFGSACNPSEQEITPDLFGLRLPVNLANISLAL